MATTYTLAGDVKKFDDASDLQAHLDELSALELVEVTKFSGNTLGVGACEGLAKVLATRAKLTTVDLSDVFTGRLISEIPDSLTFLCGSLLTVPTLTALDLSDNAFGGRSVEPMLEFLSSHPTLSNLRLNNNGLGPAGGARIAGALRENAEKAIMEGRIPPLQKLVCGRNRLEDGSAPEWAKAFKLLSGLREVSMPQNGIRMEGIEAIVTALQSCRHLELLDLQDNTATERGSRAIAVSLPFWPKLKTLNLSDCLLRTRGGSRVMQQFANGTNVQLETLKLQSNELDYRAINILAEGIEKHLKDLTALELNGNYGEEDDECYAKIKEALEKWDHGDALDELEDLEEAEEEEEEEEEEEADEADEDEAAKETPTAADPELKELAEELKEDKAEDDALAKLMDKVEIR